MDDSRKEWRSMVEFLGVDLSRSRVRRWSESDKALTFEVEGVLEPLHAAWEKPLPGTSTCCKPARVVFPFPSEVRNLRPMSAPLPSPEGTESPEGPRGFGTIRELWMETDGSYRILGSFGEVTVRSMAVRFEIASQKQCGS